MTFVTPYLPKLGVITAREHERSGKATFIKAYEFSADQCPNCQGMGIVWLIRTDSGPYTKFVPSGAWDNHGNLKIVTWFDGNERFGKGWYLIMDTLAYPCPKCGGNLQPDYQDGKGNNPAVKQLAERMRA